MRLLVTILCFLSFSGSAVASAVTLGEVNRCLRTYVSEFDGTQGSPTERLRSLVRSLPDAEEVMVIEPLTGSCAKLGPGRLEATVTKKGVTLFELSVGGEAPRFLHLVSSENQLRLHQQLEKRGVGVVSIQLLPAPSYPIYLRVIQQGAFIREEIFWGLRHVND